MGDVAEVTAFFAQVQKTQSARQQVQDQIATLDCYKGHKDSDEFKKLEFLTSQNSSIEEMIKLCTTWVSSTFLFVADDARREAERHIYAMVVDILKTMEETCRRVVALPLQMFRVFWQRAQTILVEHPIKILTGTAAVAAGAYAIALPTSTVIGGWVYSLAFIHFHLSHVICSGGSSLIAALLCAIVVGSVHLYQTWSARDEVTVRVQLQDKMHALKDKPLTVQELSDAKGFFATCFANPVNAATVRATDQR